MEEDLDFPDLTLQAALFGFINELGNILNILQNLILPTFKLHVYQSRERRVLLNLNNLIRNVTKRKLERKVTIKLLFNLNMYIDINIKITNIIFLFFLFYFIFVLFIIVYI